MITDLIIIIAIFLGIFDLFLIFLSWKHFNDCLDMVIVGLTNAHNECINRIRDDGK